VAVCFGTDSKGLKKTTKKPERKGTPKSIPIAKGFRESKGTSRGTIITGEHVARCGKRAQGREVVSDHMDLCHG